MRAWWPSSDQEIDDVGADQPGPAGYQGFHDDVISFRNVYGLFVALKCFFSHIAAC